MSETELIGQYDVTPELLEGLFKRGFFSTRIDDDGDLIVESEGPKVVVSIQEKHKLIRYVIVYGMNEFGPLDQKLSFVNRMNDDVIFARFSVPESRPEMLMCDYFLPYEEGVTAFQIVTAMRLFARVVVGAIHACDDDDLVQ